MHFLFGILPHFLEKDVFKSCPSSFLNQKKAQYRSNKPFFRSFDPFDNPLKISKNFVLFF
ncbi:hypothetical protein AO498_04775 [Algoriphagus sanaruensis]|uniref:Uncharacterized protein n=1 Tax=Algoriphagus sanaruensis TaxID=1727163 RepID=A0A142EKQ4_9BACT|nr:hypothetical protein AO498_04775 [Algoriphagus sanaruensis]